VVVKIAWGEGRPRMELMPAEEYLVGKSRNEDKGSKEGQPSHHSDADHQVPADLIQLVLKATEMSHIAPPFNVSYIICLWRQKSKIDSI